MQWMNKKDAKRLLKPIIYIALGAIGIWGASHLWRAEEAATIDHVVPTGSKHVEVLAQSEPSSTNKVTAKKGEGYINAEQAPYGYVYAAYKSSKRAKFSLVKEENAVNHDLKNDGVAQRFSLTSGSGQYLATIYENITDISYKKVKSLNFKADIHNPQAPYMVSNNVVQFDDSIPAIEKAGELVKSCTTDREKAEAIYTWVAHNIQYDFNLLGNLEAGYIPDVSQTYASKKGICYDFAVLYAAMCRSHGIACRVVSGYSDAVEGYHAWNEVYFDGAYHVVDTSTDSQLQEFPFIQQEGYEAVRYD